MNAATVLPMVLVGLIAIGLAVTSIYLTRQIARLRAEAEAAQAATRDLAERLDATRAQLEATHAQLTTAHAQQSTALAHVQALEEEDRKKAEWLDNYEKEIEWTRAELEKRPKIVRKTYKILTLGISGTGKTALTLKWANPLTDLGALQGTKIERYERTVSHVPGKDVTIEHVFEIGDWGGEHIVDAQQELIVEEIHGLLMVVDLAARDGRAVEPARIQLQLREFQPEALKFFFGPKTIASCKTVVLFINKADVIAGTPADVEREARNLYRRLIEDLEKFQVHLDVRVLVGSATYGHSTHHLFSHFVERILPKNAYDSQLLQRMKSDAMAADVAASVAAPMHATQPFQATRAQPPARPPAPPPTAPFTAPVPAGAVPPRKPDGKR